MTETPRPAPQTWRTPDWRLTLVMLIGGLLLALPLSRIAFAGHDWVAYFSETPDPLYTPQPNPSYPPWVLPLVLRPLTVQPPRSGLALVNGLTLACLTLFTYRLARLQFPQQRAPALAGVLLVALNPLVWMLMWLGTVDGLMLLGLAALPFGVPLLLLKFHISGWALLGTRRDLLWGLAWGGLSLILWGLWPLNILTAYNRPDQPPPHPLLMGWQTTGPLFILPGLVLLLLSDRDPFRLIAAGTFITPYLMPYHFSILLPALGRVRGWKQVALWIISLIFPVMSGLSSLDLKRVSFVFPLAVWLLLAPDWRPAQLWRDPDTLLNRIRATLYGLFTRWRSSHVHP
jgi:hypothetical protein